MKKANLKLIEKFVGDVNAKIQGVDAVAQIDKDRAYGGIIRAAKGKLIEEFCKEVVKIAWNELGGKSKDLTFPSKKVPVPLKMEYIEKIKSPEVKLWIKNNYNDFVFNAQVDVHVFLKDKFVLGIECKSYTENAMLKRILVDFTLLKTVYPELQCALLQLESQLTGDYSQIHNKIIFGSHSTHALMSYFDIDLNIMTLLEGERSVNKPVHKPKFFKPLKKEVAIDIVKRIQLLLKPFA